MSERKTVVSEAGAYAPEVPETWSCERQDDDSGEIYWAIHSRYGYEFITNVHDNEKRARLISLAPELADELRGNFQYLIAWRYEYANKPNDAHNNSQRDLNDAAIWRTEALLSKMKGSN